MMCIITAARSGLMSAVLLVYCCAPVAHGCGSEMVEQPSQQQPTTVVPFAAASVCGSAGRCESSCAVGAFFCRLAV